MGNLTDLDADALSRTIHSRDASCREVMQAYLARIEQVNPRYNAIVNLAPPEALLRQADECDAELSRGHSRGWMHGMPQAIKDTGHAVGFPSTLGSTVYRELMPKVDSLYVSRMKAAGCIVIGKTNMPEFGLGSHTYNDLFGTTRNAWDPDRSAGGSSGGAAVALAQRLLPVADGSDFMGSLRNPAGWNHVFGMRPSQGRVPGWPRPDVWVSQLGTDGPMARNVRDLARLLSIQAGHDPRAPLSIAEGPRDYVPTQLPAASEFRIGWLGNLDGHLAMEPGILDVCSGALNLFAQAGAQVDSVAHGFDAGSVWQSWLVWRRALVAPNVAAALAVPGAREKIKPEALWEHDSEQGLSFDEFMRASVARTGFHAQMLSLLKDFDALALPSAQLWPFEREMHWPREIAGRKMDTYHRWMEVTLYATFAGLPAVCVPAGFDPSGRWPMGLQLIGRPGADAELLRLAAVYEQLASPLLQRKPPAD
ncbi:amidase [Variovorax dokdonensis]|uniref:Amidase n=1 Tax=Variovorax dokdonensis TaxID=344883 RepID=A0ABT7NEH5_9BURK|nr:amidase [Variovorax dokdonensis]MDM0046346.1 amidase [Variovorax dokdonensis]